MRYSIHELFHTPISKANATERNVIVLLSDDAMIYTIHHLVDICLQFQLYPFLFVPLVIGFLGSGPIGEDGLPLSATVLL